MEPARISYRIYQGSTFKETLRWESETKQYAPISSITKAAPCVITTASTHAVPLNWRIRVTGVLGMKDINLASTTDYYLVTSKTTNTITLNQVNSSDYGKNLLMRAEFYLEVSQLLIFSLLLTQTYAGSLALSMTV